MVEKRPGIVIVGGGIGGLFAANALIAQGLNVSVYEQAPALGEVGAGVFLTPNSVRQLQRVGLGPSVEKWGARVGSGSHYYRHDGAPDRAGAGDELVGLERDLRHAPRRLRRFSRQGPARRRGAHRTPRDFLRADRRRRPGVVREWRRRRRRPRHRRRRHPFRAAPLRVPALQSGLPRLGRLPRHCSA